MAFKFNPMHVVRGLQALFALVTLSLFASVASYLNSLVTPPTPPTMAYPIFVSTLSLLISLPYLVLAPYYFPTIAHKYAMLAIEGITMILWFVAWIAPAAYVGSLKVCKGGVCHTARAGIIFAVLEWLLFVCTSVLAARYCFGFLGGNIMGGKEVDDGSLKGLNISKPIPMSTSNGTGTPGIGLTIGGGTWPSKHDDYGPRSNNSSIV